MIKQRFNLKLYLISYLLFIFPLIAASEVTSLIPKYRLLKLNKAGISIEVPKNWIQQQKDTVWSPSSQGMPRVGFKWTRLESDWEPTNLLPKKSEFLGPFMVDLGWEQGLLYIVQTQDKVPTLEIHVVIPRMDAQLAYDFYAIGQNLSQLKQIEYVNQHMSQSGQLMSIKNYLSRDLKECQEISLDCSIYEEEFTDKQGCGCLLEPQTEAVYDN